MDVTVEWIIAEARSARTEVPEDATPVQILQAAAAKALEMAGEGQGIIQHTVRWSAADGQFGRGTINEPQ